ncbi:FAD:protein FMN transferase [Oxalobacteraceae bacterium]|nr:FAD:protein FMN transferase [Oxalobacteraceae bacterium]
MKRRTFVCAAFGAIGGMAAIAHSAGGTVYRGAALAFGTTIGVTVVHDDAVQAHAGIDAALQAALAVDRLMSIYDPASQVHQLNARGSLARPDPRLLAVLEQARQLSQLSGGAFDITVQPLWQVFSAAAARGGLPSEAERRRAAQLVDWRELEFGRGGVHFRRPGMALTLNGLAQGYAADQAMAALQAHGIRHALLDTGEFAARGSKAAGTPWKLGIRDPRDAAALAATLDLRGCGLATSGDYASAFTPDFAHHHIFDPQAGDSPRELAAVSVLAPTAMLADGLSTAFMVMGRERARAMAARLPAVDLLTVDKRGAVWRSATFPREA